MPSRARCLAVAFATALALVAVAAPASQATCIATPRLNGSIIQPELPSAWTSSLWEIELGRMQEDCMHQLIVNWAADTKARTAIYATGVRGFTQNTSTDVLDHAYEQAEGRGMDVFAGLTTNPDWFVKHADDVTWLENEARLANEFADEIYANYHEYESFAGWYLPFEVDNFFFTTRTSWDNLIRFYNTIINNLHRRAPGLPVVIAPFFNTSGGQTSSEWTTMWTYILQNTNIDVIALQDGVGAQHATSGQLATWFSATKDAITASRRSTQLWDDAETFNGDFHTLAIGDLVTDMRAVSPYVSNYTSFSYNHYMSNGQVSSIWDATYRAYLTNGSVETTAPTSPTPSATASGSMTVNLSWREAFDSIGIAGYRIYRDGELVETSYGIGTRFSDGQLTPGTTYTYTMQAFDAAGNVSAMSSSVRATTSAGTTYATNLASRKTYTATLAADATYPDSGGTELTNGTFASALLSDAAWQGRLTEAPYSFTIDLGSSQTIHQIKSDWFQVKSATVLLPASVTYEVSTNGTTWTPVGTVTKPAVGAGDQSKAYTVTDLASTSGRYVRVTATPASGSWTFIDEIEVRQ